MQIDGMPLMKCDIRVISQTDKVDAVVARMGEGQYMLNSCRVHKSWTTSSVVKHLCV